MGQRLDCNHLDYRLISSVMSNLSDSTVEASVGGIVLLRRKLFGNALGERISNADGRVFTLTVRLEPNLVRHLPVCYVIFCSRVIYFS